MFASYKDTINSMELRKTWFEKLDELGVEECLPLGNTPKASVYSAMWDNREKFGDKKFRVQKDKKTKKHHVCRIK